VALVENQSMGKGMTWKELSSRRGAGAGLRKLLLVALSLAGPLLLLRLSAGLAKNDQAPTQGTEPKDGYIGSQACSGCHSDIYRRFSQTSMGRSMSLVTPAFLENTPRPASYFNEQLNRHFEVYSQEGKLYQSEWGSDPEGKESFRTAHQIEWIIGAGVNGLGGIIQKDKYRFRSIPGR
jgi:hypothetical protein